MDTRASGLERGALMGVTAFAIVASVGFGWFGLHPDRVASLGGGGVRFYSVSYRVFALGQVAIAAGALVLVLIRRAGVRWLTAFVAVYGLSLASELVGTRFGVPFGEYGYAPVLNPMWLGRVPVVIPLSWFVMAVPSYALGGLGARSSGARRVLLGSFWLLAWDLALDPAMSRVTRYWIWSDPGSYYGMPLLNLFGWYLTGLVLMVALRTLGADRWLGSVPRRWLALFYAANLILPLAMCAMAGLWGAVLAASLAVALAAALGRALAEGAGFGRLLEEPADVREGVA